jgi:predicted amidohydrolase YtcJ
VRTVSERFFSKPNTVTSAAQKLSGRKRSEKSPRPGRKAKSNRKPSSVHPSYILVNGNILTMEPKHPSAQAIAIVGNRILRTGTNKEISTLSGKNSTTINLKGSTVLPGFTDCHIHLIEYGLSLNTIDLRDVQTIEKMKRLVAQRAAKTTGWVLGRGWDQEKFAENRYPTRHDLDEASPNNPAILTRVCGHICIVNTLALKEANIDSHTPNPEGGVIDRDASGEPTGILREKAVGLVEAKIPPPPVEDYVKATLAACQKALEAGLTAVHCITSSPQELKALLNLKAEGRLPLRFYVFIPDSELGIAKALGLRSGFGDEWVRLGGVKIFTDGSLGARTAALQEPYNDDPSNVGVAVHTQTELNTIISEAHAAGLQAAVHAIGDRAIAMVLDAINEAKKLKPSEDLRHRIEHVSVVNPKLIGRMKRTGLIASVQPHFITSDYWLQQRLGITRAAFTYPLRSMLQNGIRVVGGSDCPVDPLTPLSGIEAAVNRPGSDEAVSVEDAISFYTRSAAYASFDEDFKGTISPGKYADLVVLAQDPRKVSTSAISKIPILMTMVGGRIAYKSRGFA